MNHHTLADFRVAHGALLDRRLTTSVATPLAEGLVGLTRVAQDGMRERAIAGAASSRRRGRLAQCLAEAEAQVGALKQEPEADPGATTRRPAAARPRAAEARRAAADQATARVSTTEPDARVMRMADGGFRPAWNVRFAMDTGTQVIVGMAVTNGGSVAGQLGPTLEQVRARCGRGRRRCWWTEGVPCTPTCRPPKRWTALAHTLLRGAALRGRLATGRSRSGCPPRRQVAGRGRDGWLGALRAAQTEGGRRHGSHGNCISEYF